MHHVEALYTLGTFASTLCRVSRWASIMSFLLHILSFSNGISNNPIFISDATLSIFVNLFSTWTCVQYLALHIQHQTVNHTIKQTINFKVFYRQLFRWFRMHFCDSFNNLKVDTDHLFSHLTSLIDSSWFFCYKMSVSLSLPFVFVALSVFPLFFFLL